MLQRQSGERTLTIIFLIIGWVFWVCTLIGIIIFKNASKSALKRLSEINKLVPPYYGIPDDNIGCLPSTGTVPIIYDTQIALYLKDSIIRYSNYFTGETDSFETRTGQKVESTLYQASRHDNMSCIVMSQSDKSAAIIMFKGTTTIEDWKNDLDVEQEQLKGALEGVKVHRGFQRSFEANKEEIMSTLKKIGSTRVFIVGQSLGGGVANIAAASIRDSGIYDANHIYTVTFGSPRVGGNAFFNHCQDLKIFQLRNTADIVPNAPFAQEPNFKGQYKTNLYRHAGVGLLFFNPSYSVIGAHMLLAYEKNMDDLKKLQSYIE